jgi:hypothetical protein
MESGRDNRATGKPRSREGSEGKLHVPGYHSIAAEIREVIKTILNFTLETSNREG